MLWNTFHVKLNVEAITDLSVDYLVKVRGKMQGSPAKILLHSIKKNIFSRPAFPTFDNLPFVKAAREICATLKIVKHALNSFYESGCTTAKLIAFVRGY